MKKKNSAMNVTSHQNPADHSPANQTDPAALKDPVCDMAVTEQSAHQTVHESRTFYFCSAKCQGKFVANARQYLAPAPTPEQAPAAAGTVYTCPMHPKTRQDHPGNCPKCGMTLEPLLPELEEQENPEPKDFQHRFWWTLPLTVVVTELTMFGHSLGWFDMAVQSWIELVLSVPIVLWTGWPFFVRGLQSVLNRGCVRNRCVVSELAKWLIDRHEQPESSIRILSTALTTVKFQGVDKSFTQKTATGSFGSGTAAHFGRDESFRSAIRMACDEWPEAEVMRSSDPAILE